MPIFAASCTTGQGNSSFSSHSCAAGRTVCSANPCAHSRMSFWSWESSSENGESGDLDPEALGRLGRRVLRLDRLADLLLLDLRVAVLGRLLLCLLLGCHL